MKNMNPRTSEILEFDKVKAMLAQRAASVMGSELCLAMTPEVSYDRVQALQDETEEAEGVLFRIGRSPVEPFDNILPHIKRVELNSLLTLSELLQVARFLRAVQYTLTQTGKDESITVLKPMIDLLVTDKHLEQDLSNSIISAEEVSDQASPRLASIRRKIQSSNSKIKEMLQGFIRSSAYSKYLQDAIVTVRNDRYVLPVKSEYRTQVPGLVHDQSASGATIFIEPLSVVQVNNELKQLALEEKEEIEEIVRDFTLRIAELADALHTDVEVMSRLDVIFARARFSRDFRCVRPMISSEQVVRIRQARHPLIERQRVVPIDIALGEEYSLLLITGPNTGGKTVALKTTGLFVLMAQSGMHVPAMSAELGVFEDVFADIGDAQSIEQSLSTFSSHMSNIARILERVTPKSLVLFDELGAGTDPDEGAALAMAILDHLRQYKVCTVATTHYSQLKAYATTAQGAQNASVEFDVQSLSPTYRLLIGVPGGSNAFAISKRLGIEEHIISRAKGYLSEETLKIDEVLQKAEEYKQQAEAERQSMHQTRLEAERMLREAHAQVAEAEAKRDRILQKAKDRADDILRDASDQAKESIAEMKKLLKATASESLTKARKINTKLEDSIAKQVVETRKSDTSQVTKGQQVHIISLDADGVALSGKDEKGQVAVSVGSMQVRVDITDIEILQKGKEQAQTRSSVSLQNKGVKMEIDVRGQTLDEALMNVDMYLDNAFLSSLGEVVIIHGKGTGVLRDGIRRHLQRHPQVKSFRSGVYGEGEQGVTVVTLK